LLWILLCLCTFVIPLESTWWLVCKITTDLFVMLLIAHLLFPGLSVLLRDGLKNEAMIQVALALIIWVTPMVFNIGSIYWHTSINYAFLHDCSPQVNYLKRDKTDERMVLMIRHEMRQRWNALSAFRSNLLRSLTPFFLLPENRFLDFELYLKQADRDEKEVLALFGNSVFCWVLLLVSCGAAGFLASVFPTPKLPPEAGSVVP